MYTQAIVVVITVPNC